MSLFVSNNVMFLKERAHKLQDEKIEKQYVGMRKEGKMKEREKEKDAGKTKGPTFSTSKLSNIPLNFPKLMILYSHPLCSNCPAVLWWEAFPLSTNSHTFFFKSLQKYSCQCLMKSKAFQCGWTTLYTIWFLTCTTLPIYLHLFKSVLKQGIR